MEKSYLRIPADSKMPRWTMGCAAVMFLTQFLYITIIEGELFFGFTLPVSFWDIKSVIFSLYETAAPAAIFILAATYVKKDLELMELPLFFIMTGDLSQYLLALAKYSTWRYPVWILSRCLLFLFYLLLFAIFFCTASGKIKSRNPLVFEGTEKLPFFEWEFFNIYILPFLF